MPTIQIIFDATSNEEDIEVTQKDIIKCGGKVLSVKKCVISPSTMFDVACESKDQLLHDLRKTESGDYIDSVIEKQ